MVAFEQALLGTPDRMTVTNLVTQETVTVQFNPTEFEHLVEVNWQRFTVPGLSHQPKHYVGTSNPTFPMELFYRATTNNQLKEIHDKIRFFESLAYPVSADTVAGGGPPRVLFRWPQMVAVVCTLNSLGQRFMIFTPRGKARVLRVRVEFEEIRSIRLLSDEVRRNGLFRAQGQGVPKTIDPF